MAVEFELKYRADPERLGALARRYPALSPIQMETAYFDTRQGDLSRRRWILRRRLENGRAVYTCKTPGEGGARGEWETHGQTLSQAIEALCNLGAPAELLTLTAPGVEPVCGARFTRLAGRIALEAAVVELALDQGELLGGGRSLPFCEVGVELKEGAREAAAAFGQALALAYGLEPEEKSKAQRALALAGR